ncbi:hypothetical protein [Spirillospora sp. NPDC029432]|uniref:hypothetical protein n=1 Tax=Spirillospora sp. NPDC029432 TaxID=3154599 RepID=UPI0034512BAB
MKALVQRIVHHHRSGGRAVQFHERSGQVCGAACRAAAHRDRATIAAPRVRA